MGQKQKGGSSGGRRKIGRSHRTTMGKSLVPRSKNTLLTMGEASVATVRKA